MSQRLVVAILVIIFVLFFSVLRLEREGRKQAKEIERLRAYHEGREILWARRVNEAVAAEREFLTRDHPMAKGRLPVAGDEEWIFTLPLHDGTTLTVKTGRIGRDALIRIAHEEAADDELAAVLRVTTEPSNG